MNQSKLVELTKSLISIPSFVDETNDESNLGTFIFRLLSANPKLTVTKQYCSTKRFNILATLGNQIDTLVVGHLDTIQPSSSWTIDPLKPFVSKGSLFGLGSSDMKSGIAVMISAALNPKLKPNTGFLFYLDEEYDFLGMKQFIAEYATKISPKQIISLDGTNLSISNGCRGLIELTVTVKGQSAHAARPKNGLNAITKSFVVYTQLTNWLDNFVDSKLGPTTSNLAFIQGGQFKSFAGDQIVVGKQGNIVPDICQFVIDIRPSKPQVNGKSVTQFLTQEITKQGLTLDSLLIRHDLGCWLTTLGELDPLVQGLPQNQIEQTGYLDLQLLWQAFKVPCYTIGAGNQMAHKADEYVLVRDLIELEKIINNLLLTNI